MFWILFLFVTDAVVSAHSTKADNYEVTIRMPGAVSDKDDALICHAVKLDPEEAYILRFEPHASKTTAHHMNVYGCGVPGSRKPKWECRAMDDMSDKSVCGDGERQIVWAWAMDATARDFPEGRTIALNVTFSDVGFRVGGDTKINYIVIQLHYARKFNDGETDNSGVTLLMTKTPQHFQAGYYVMYNYGYIPPNIEEFHSESACEFDKDYTIHPIGYRTHSHNLGVVTSGYLVKDNHWTEIGRMSPQLPQTFYNVTTPGLEIKKGDILAARCTMSSQRSFFTRIGERHVDEMCNFYVLYYTAFPGTLRIQYCYRDAQTFHWAEFLRNIPASASSTQGLPPFTRVDSFADMNVPKRQMGLM